MKQDNIKPNRLSGPMKVAILIHSMGEQATKELMDILNETEKKILAGNLKLVKSIPMETIEAVAVEFIELAEKAKRNSTSIEQTMKEQISKPDNTKQSSTSTEQQTTEASEEDEFALKTLQGIEAEQLTEMIKDEHPQTIAVIIVHLKPETASEVLSRLPVHVKVEVAMRIARLDKVQSGMILEIDTVFEEVLKKKNKSVTRKTGGIAHLAELLNLVDGSTCETILNEMEESNPELVAQIKLMMFVFEDLVLVNDKGLQKVFRRVETNKLALALKGASDDVKNKIYKNISERAGAMLKEEVEAIGAVRMKDVEEAQQSITKVIQELEASGELVIMGRKGGDLIT
ncbi:MAG: flagellar motor switch protein FliG [Desulfatirhabdiaceae bacterium]